MKKKYSIIFFFLILAGISLYYNYHEIVLKKPQSIHKWRQSDCASIALNYYQDGMRFFQPQTHNLTSDGGTSGKSCTSEVPILYYSVAVLYKIFGYHDWVYRIFNMLLFLLGIFYLFRLFLYVLGDPFWAISLAIFFFTSPVLVYYGNNYLSNSSALAFVFIGWYYFIRYSSESNAKLLTISMAAFFLAASFKVTALFSVFAILGVYIVERLKIKKIRIKERVFKHQLLFLLSALAIFLFIGLWIFYAHTFNKRHETTYFSTTIFPIWDYNLESIKSILKQINKVWVPEYFHFSALFFIASCFVFVFLNFRKNGRIFKFSILFLLVEALFYFLFQFWTFADHDYYTIDLYILPVIVVNSAFAILKRSYVKIFNLQIVKILFGLFLIFNIYYARQRIDYRYDANGWMNDYAENKDIYSIKPYLREIGVTPKDTVISIPDGSHASLYLMNQKGWTEYTDAKFMRGEPIRYNQDSIGIQSSIEKGARYLIVNGIDQLYSKPYLQGYCTHLKGNYNNVMIFDLKNLESNFSLRGREIKSILRCSADYLSQDKKYFVDGTDSTLFEGGFLQTTDFARSGKFSVKLNSKSPFGMTIKLNGLKNGESFVISVWRKSGENSTGYLIASSEPNKFYHNKFKVTETDSGWERIVKEFFVSSDLDGQELGVYVYNPDEEPVYFDDLEIVWYRSIFEKNN